MKHVFLWTATLVFSATFARADGPPYTRVVDFGGISRWKGDIVSD